MSKMTKQQHKQWIKDHYAKNGLHGLLVNEVACYLSLELAGEDYDTQCKKLYGQSMKQIVDQWMQES